ncbi:MAG TPA: ribbon-helix-helix protein, CopG family [Polyangia bacterium]|jgi:metal-responsive CopG/Arc/MetJ family transcriptional regulator
MARKTKILGFSVPPEVADEYAAMAARQGKSRSELFREMVEVYRRQQDEEELFRLQRRMSKAARATGSFTERDVERIVFADR